MEEITSNKIISSILKHDRMQTTFKIALVRAINDIALSYPETGSLVFDVAVPFRLLAEFWVAYYYPFVDPANPIHQGVQAVRGGTLYSDMSFRSELTAFREAWQEHHGGISNPADGFYAINELRLPRNQTTYDPKLLTTYRNAIKAISKSIEKPIQHAGPPGLVWSVFEKPRRFKDISQPVDVIPGTQQNDLCLVVKRNLWQTFRTLSLWIEALCIHEWCLFTEQKNAQNLETTVNRGDIYNLLTARPDNRRPLTWERNQVDILLLEGHEFSCPWTQIRIRRGTAYDLDHILPLAIYPINELWNLVPADPRFNSHGKRDKLPSSASLENAESSLNATYITYSASRTLGPVLYDDVTLRFGAKPSTDFARSTVLSVINFIQQIGEARNLAQF